MPTMLKLARGNPGKRPLNEAEPELPPAGVRPPEDLRGIAKRTWEAEAPALIAAGLLTVADLPAFRDYCELTAELRRYQRVARTLGPVETIQKRVQDTINKVRGQRDRLLVEFGQTPSSRSRVKVTKSTGAGDPRRERFFGGDRRQTSSA